MLSLPLIAPRDQPLSRSTMNNGQEVTSLSSSIQITRRSSSARSPLAVLRADEHIIQLRKFSVRRYGAGWLRPPGIAKTLQSKLEEAQEQLEQMEIQRREIELRAQEAAAQQQANLSITGENDDGIANEDDRDLDADVPDAEQSGLASDDDIDQTTSVTFHESSLLQGSPSGGRQLALDTEDAELDGRLQDERDLGMEGDLDDDVPEAGSYEHTDTEQEDDSSDEDVMASRLSLEAGQAPARGNEQSRRSLLAEDSELLASSSFVESSPALSRRTERRSTALLNAARNRTRHQ